MKLPSLFALFISSFLLPACAQDKPGGDPVPIQLAAVTSPGGNAGSQWVAAHNKHRNKKNLPALAWSAELAQIAQAWADRLAAEQCGNLEHRPGSFRNPRNLGENLALASASPSPPSKSPASVVDDWASEEAFYDYDANECQAGQACGHYTQMVWRDTQEFGCGEASCTDGEWLTKMWACNYRPAGNYVGEKPY